MAVDGRRWVDANKETRRTTRTTTTQTIRYDATDKPAETKGRQTQKGGKVCEMTGRIGEQREASERESRGQRDAPDQTRAPIRVQNKTDGEAGQDREERAWTTAMEALSRPDVRNPQSSASPLKLRLGFHLTDIVYAS